MTNSLHIPLTAHHLRFTVRVTRPVVFGEFKGSALRGAFAGYLRRTFCPEWRAEETDPLHKALCPACQMLALDGGDGVAGDVRRPYAIEPPTDGISRYDQGETFDFGMVLYGDNLGFLPYLVLAVKGMGEQGGVGQKDAQGRRGTFAIHQIQAVNPISGQTQLLLEPGGKSVQMPAIPVTQEQVQSAALTLAAQLDQSDNRLRVTFLTPTRLTQGDHRVETPAPFPLIKQTVLRVMDLAAQHGGGRPTVDGEPIALGQHIYVHADQVQKVADQTRWWDLHGYSGRLGRAQPLGGLVGSVTYTAPDWTPLLPWLVWGISAHVGKNIVKGCGWYDLAAGDHTPTTNELAC